MNPQPRLRAAKFCGWRAGAGFPPYAPIPVYDDEGWNVEDAGVNADLSYCDPSFYRARVTAPADLVLVASGVAVGRETAGSTQTVTFAAGPSRDFYLAGSADFTVISVQAGETRVNSYAPPEWAAGARRAADVAQRSLLHFNARFGSYPYTEMDVVSTPLLALGIEYPGITGISLRLYDPTQEVNGLPALSVLESVVAHEMAHQWFDNLVGSDQVDEPWLDEALAQYATGLYYTGHLWRGRCDKLSRVMGQPVGTRQAGRHPHRSASR